jgi:SAM-dependent methyltransferase
MDNFDYVGKELTIFAHAANWKKYYSSIIRPYFGQRVVEVGAGLGATTAIMCDGTQDKWICLEPDSALRVEIDRLISEGKLPGSCRTQSGFVSDLSISERFDTFIYIDVLEHIADDHAELESAAARLAPGGTLIVLSPAFNFLYSPFDKSIGHYRRYDKKMIRALTPTGCHLEKLIYLDSVGMATSLVNRFLLRQPMPTVEQILFWDKRILPFSRFLDPLVGYGFGRSIVAIWKMTK